MFKTLKTVIPATTASRPPGSHVDDTFGNCCSPSGDVEEDEDVATAPEGGLMLKVPMRSSGKPRPPRECRSIWLGMEVGGGEDGEVMVVGHVGRETDVHVEPVRRATRIELP